MGKENHMFGEMLKMMRKSRNLNQVQLAAQLNVDVYKRQLYC